MLLHWCIDFIKFMAMCFGDFKLLTYSMTSLCMVPLNECNGDHVGHFHPLSLSMLVSGSYFVCFSSSLWLFLGIYCDTF